MTTGNGQVDQCGVAKEGLNFLQSNAGVPGSIFVPFFNNSMAMNH